MFWELIRFHSVCVQSVNHSAGCAEWTPQLPLFSVRSSCSFSPSCSAFLFVSLLFSQLFFFFPFFFKSFLCIFNPFYRLFHRLGILAVHHMDLFLTACLCERQKFEFFLSLSPAFIKLWFLIILLFSASSSSGLYQCNNCVINTVNF